MIRDYIPIISIFSIVLIMVGLFFVGNITIEEDKKYEELFFENPSDVFDSATTESFIVIRDQEFLVELSDYNEETQHFSSLMINIDYYKEIPCPQPQANKGIQFAVICFEIKEGGSG